MAERARIDARAWVGGTVVLLLVLVAVFARWLTTDPLDQDLLSGLLPPAWAQGGDHAHLLGTDGLGRDVLARLAYATRIALFVAVGAAGARCAVRSGRRPPAAGVRRGVGP